ncbi:G2/mitotic-specific cyclin [Malassezia furfur]|uniref:G2/mitotic-specific cyclin n=1 Tax=Malassezia furfur TaxID=55194 RepID=A0ABY8ET35_MALFU|nr:CLB2 [Malassezia furfur]WFD47493.1 G2/mitotic-specific cyclin [Malassezia furfur]
MSSNLPVRRAPVRTRSAASKTDENANTYRPLRTAGGAGAAKDVLGKSKAASASTESAPTRPNGAASGVLGIRKRAALGDLTNATRARTAALSKPGEKSAADEKEAKPPRTRATVSSLPTRAGSTQMPTRSAATRRVLRAKHEAPEAMMIDEAPRDESDKENVHTQQPAERVEATEVRETKRAKVAEAAPVRAKDEGWEDLDKDDIDDPLMVAEYVEEIFAYMRQIELQCMPNGDYMSMQRDLNWHLRGVLADWLIETHSKFRLLPETLFLALNVVDRFLSLRTISLSKLQLVGVTSLFIAAKYEEVLCPSIQNFLYLADGGYTDEEILRAERYMLKVLNFDLSYASPMNFLRRISKADNYDIQTRTVAKYFMEISLVDHRLMEHPPSLIAAAAVWMAREVLERGEWTPTLVHYSTYAENELLGTAEIMLDYCLRPPAHAHFHKKYSSKKFMRASAYVLEWAKNTFPNAVITEQDIALGRWTDEAGESHSLEMLRVDLYARHGHPRPSVLPLGSAPDSSPNPLREESTEAEGAS